jgi:hypothetical protein
VFVKSAIEMPLQSHAQSSYSLEKEVANTMMEHLPPSGWSDVARKPDIELLQKDVARVESSLKADIKGLRIAIGALIPTMVAGFIGLYSALVSKL